MLTLTEAQLAKLQTILGEVPMKYAMPIVSFLNQVALENSSQQKPAG